MGSPGGMGWGLDLRESLKSESRPMKERLCGPESSVLLVWEGLGGGVCVRARQETGRGGYILAWVQTCASP